MDVLYDVLKVSRDLIMKEPFYGLLLSTLNRIETKEVPVAGVRKNGLHFELGVNPDVWPTLPANLRYGILKHELLHVCFFHPIQGKRYPDKKLYNVACDMEINQYVEDKYKEGAEWIDHTDYGLPSYMGSDFYYKELQKMKGNNPQLDNLLANMPDQSGNGGGHDQWKEVENSSESEKKIMENQLKHQMKEADKSCKRSRGRGILPDKLSELLDSFNNIDPPVLDWKAYLRRFSGGSTKYYTHKTRRKNSTRFSDSPGLKVKQKNHLFVALDTSGSVSNEDFKEFMDQIHYIFKCGTEVTLAHTDADVAHVEKYTGRKKIERHGYGGTDFDPAIKYFNKHKSKYTSMVYFTDGECVPPKTKPFKPMLWVISSRGSKLDGLPGFQICINKKNEK